MSGRLKKFGFRAGAATIALLFVVASAGMAQDETKKEKEKRNPGAGNKANPERVRGERPPHNAETPQVRPSRAPEERRVPAAPQVGAPASRQVGPQPEQQSRPMDRTPQVRQQATPVDAGGRFGQQSGQPGQRSPGQGFGAARQTPSAPAVRTLPGGGTARYSMDGHPTEVRRNGLTVHEAPGGIRQTVVERPGGRTVVTYGRGGYVQRGFVSGNGQTYVQRSYYVNGRTYVRVYQPVTYRGIVVNVYAPRRYYAPAFYSYAYSPWGRPVIYSGWGWQATAWFGVYGGFFTPYPVYASPVMWLTDYMIAASYRDAYEARMQASAGYSNNFDRPLSPELKEQIAREVEADLRRQQDEAQGRREPQRNLPILDNRPHTLQVYASMNVVSQGGECGLTEGDIVEFNGAQPNDGLNGTVFVKYSKVQDCPVNTLVAIPVDQLQEMSNRMLENMEQGLQELQQNQGRSGLPPLNPSLMNSSPAPYTGDLPPVERDVQKELAQASAEGASAVGDAARADGNSGPPTLTLGQTQAQVTEMLGDPLRRAIVGDKVILFYKDVKITLENGVVIDIQ